MLAMKPAAQALPTPPWTPPTPASAPRRSTPSPLTLAELNHSEATPKATATQRATPTSTSMRNVRQGAPSPPLRTKRKPATDLRDECEDEDGRPERPAADVKRRAREVEEGEVEEGKRLRRGKGRLTRTIAELPATGAFGPPGEAKLGSPITAEGGKMDKGKDRAPEYAARAGSARAQLPGYPFSATSAQAAVTPPLRQPLRQPQPVLKTPTSAPSTLTTFARGITPALPSVPPTTLFGKPVAASAFTQGGSAGTLASAFGSRPFSAPTPASSASTSSGQLSAFAASSGQTTSQSTLSAPNAPVQHANPGAFGFGQRSTNAFGVASGFGQPGSSGVGQSGTAGVFGQGSTNTFGQSCPSAFGAQTNSSSAFGQAGNSTVAGQPLSSSGFWQAASGTTQTSRSSPMKGVEGASGADGSPMKGVEGRQAAFGSASTPSGFGSSSSFTQSGGKSSGVANSLSNRNAWSSDRQPLATAFLQGGSAGTLSKAFGSSVAKPTGSQPAPTSQNQAFAGSANPSTLDGMHRRPHYPTPIFDAFAGPVPPAAAVALRAWLLRITDGSVAFAAPEEELAQIPLLMRTHGAAVRQVLTSRLQGYRPHHQTLKALEVASWLEAGDVRPLRSVIRGCQATNHAGVKKMAGQVLAGMDRR